MKKKKEIWIDDLWNCRRDDGLCLPEKRVGGQCGDEKD